MDTVKRSKSQRLTKKIVIAALEAHGGNVSAAARALGCSRSNLNAWITRHKDVRAALEDTREEFKDLVESKARELIMEGNTAMIIFTLKTQVRDRGWVERQEVEHTGSVDTVYRVLTPRILEEE